MGDKMYRYIIKYKSNRWLVPSFADKVITNKISDSYITLLNGRVPDFDKVQEVFDKLDRDDIEILHFKLFVGDE